MNLFAFRATDLGALCFAADPVGPHPTLPSPRSRPRAQTLVAWDAHGRLRHRSSAVGQLLDAPMRLGITKRGEPRHPLYVSGETPPVPWAPLAPTSPP